MKSQQDTITEEVRLALLEWTVNGFGEEVGFGEENGSLFAEFYSDMGDVLARHPITIVVGDPEETRG